MNPYIAKKAGEVLAFARSGVETLELGKGGLLKILDEEVIDSAGDELQILEEKIGALIQQENVAAHVEEMATKTQEKVRDMRERYLDGNWDKPDEVLEWMGFYTGAALVHWYLLAGAARSHTSPELGVIAREAITFYTSLFIVDETLLADIGATRAKA